MNVLPDVPTAMPILNVILCVLLGLSGYLWGRAIQAGVTGAAVIFAVTLSAAALVTLVLLNLGESVVPIALGVVIHLAGSCAALLGGNRD